MEELCSMIDFSEVNTTHVIIKVIIGVVLQDSVSYS